MKTRTKVFICVGVAVLIAAAVLCTVFLLKTKNIERNEKQVNFVGTWKVFANGDEEDKNRYFVFDDKIAQLYVGSATAAKTTEYTVKAEANNTFELSLGELGAFKVSKISDSIVILANGVNVYHIVKLSDAAYKTATNYAVGDFSGCYDVNVHSETTKSKMQYVEYMTFENGKLSDYRDEKLYAEFDFTVENNVLSAGPLKFYICEVSADKIVLAEVTTTENNERQHLIWELVGRK